MGRFTKDATHRGGGFFKVWTKRTSSNLYDLRGKFLENYRILYKLMGCTYCILTRSMVLVHSYNYNFVIFIDIFYIVYIYYLLIIRISINDEYNLTNVVVNNFNVFSKIKGGGAE